MRRKKGLTEARKKGWCRSPDDIDHRAHVGGSPFMVSAVSGEGVTALLRAAFAQTRGETAAADGPPADRLSR